MTLNNGVNVASTGFFDDETPGPNVGRAQVWFEDGVRSRSVVDSDAYASTAVNPGSMPTGHFLVYDGDNASPYESLGAVAWRQGVSAPGRSGSRYESPRRSVKWTWSHGASTWPTS